MFDLADPNPYRLEGEQGLWILAAKELPPGTVLDIGMPKPQAEILVGGHAAAPNGQPTERMILGWAMGPAQKQLLVTGDRYWQMTPSGWRATPPQPFLQMPLAPQRAFGGEGFAANPLGTGYLATRRGMAGEVIALPNIEIPQHALQSIDAVAPSAAFGPMAFDAKERLQYAGRYGAAWLKTVAPALATDADPRLFMFAPQDQRLPGFLAGDEPYALQNFAADKPLIKGYLPGFRVRCFIGWTDTKRAVVELPTRIDTLWLVAGARRGIMVYRAATAVEDLDGKDVADITVAYERQENAPRPLSHYLEVRRLRLDPATASRYAFSEHQLAPALPQAELERRAARRRELAEQRATQRQDSMRWAIEQELKRAGIPAAFQPEITIAPSSTDLPQILPEELESGEIDLAEILDALDAIEAKAVAEIDKREAELAPVRETFAKISSGEAAPGDIDALLASLGNSEGAASIDASFEHVGPLPEVPPDTDPAKIADLENKLGRAKNWRQEIIGAATPETNDPEQFKLAQARYFALPEGRPLEAVRRAISDDAFALPEFPPLDLPEEAHTVQQQPAPRLSIDDLVATVDNGDTPPEAVEKIRTFLTQAQAALVEAAPRLAAGSRSPFEALTGPERPPVAQTPQEAIVAVGAQTSKELTRLRSELDRAEAQMADSMAVLRRNSPEPIKPDIPFSPAVARSLGDVVEQEFRSGHALAGRDLAGADLSGRDFSQADFSGAFLERANLKATKLTGANLTNAAMTGATLINADVSHAQLSDANLCKTDCRGTRFAGSQLFRTQFLGARLECASFDKAQMRDLQMLETPMTRATFRAAQIHQTFFIRANLADSIWDNATIERAQFIDLSLAGARFPGARLEQTCFLKVQAPQLDFSASRLNQVSFIGDIDLRGARFDRSSTATLSFHGADITGADFTMARLDGVYFGKSVLAGSAFRMSSMKGAVLTGNDLKGADFYAANLLEAHVNQADLSGASLRHSNLFGADLMDSVLVAADLSDANINRTILVVAAQGSAHVD